MIAIVVFLWMLIFAGLVLYIIGVTWIYQQVKYKLEGRNAAREKIYDTHKGLLDKSKWYHVHYFRDIPGSQIFSSGILYLTGNEVGFFPDPDIDIPELRLSREQLEVDWVGTIFKVTGFTPWFKITSNGKEYYFRAETGPTIWGAKRTTREICEILVRWKQGIG